MNTARNLTRAKLIQIRWNASTHKAEPVDDGKKVTVQFNPASLRVTYTNQVQTDEQNANGGIQYVGRGSSKLSVELIFDVSMPPGRDTESEEQSTEPVTDVREMTRHVAFFITPVPGEGADEGKFVPPGVRLLWGTFLFDGIVESLDETLDLWSEEGRPLRATVSLNLMQQGIMFDFNEDATPPPGAQGSAPGTRPLQPARAGDSLQSMATRAGRAGDWKRIAEANGIENPRTLAPGTLIDLRR